MGSWAGRIRSIKRTAALAVLGTAVGFILLELLSRTLLPAGSPLERIYPADAVRFETIDEDVFYDIIHVTRPGKEILARAMAEHVAERATRTGGPASEG